MPCNCLASISFGQRLENWRDKVKQKRNHRMVWWLLPGGKLRDAMELYPGKTREEVQEIVWKELVKKLV